MAPIIHRLTFEKSKKNPLVQKKKKKSFQNELCRIFLVCSQNDQFLKLETNYLVIISAKKNTNFHKSRNPNLIE